MIEESTHVVSPAGSARAYLFFAFLSLGAVFLAQLQQGLFLSNLLVVAVGVLGLVSRLRLGPVIFTTFLGVIQIGFQVLANRLRLMPRFRLLEADDVILCIGVLGYVAAHYRLQGIWNNLLAVDPRRRSGPPRTRLLGLPRSAPVEKRRRPEALITVQEISVLVVSLAGWALAAQVCLAALAPSWDILSLPARWVRILLPLWALGMGVFVMASHLQLWKRRHMSPEAALLFMQDTLWQETRGEQRRIQRWLTWRRNRQGERQDLNTP